MKPYLWLLVLQWSTARSCFHRYMTAHDRWSQYWRAINNWIYSSPPVGDMSVCLEYWHTSTWLKTRRTDSFITANIHLNKGGSALCLAICAIWITSTFHSWCSVVTAIVCVWLSECIRETNKPRRDKNCVSSSIRVETFQRSFVWSSKAGCFLLYWCLMHEMRWGERFQVSFPPRNMKCFCPYRICSFNYSFSVWNSVSHWLQSQFLTQTFNS